MTTRLNEIKLEGNELQSYLETFNKDLEGNGQQTITLIQEADENDEEEEEEGTYFVDQAGNYYYQATKDSDPILTEPPDGDNIQFIVEEDNSIENADTIEHEVIDHTSASVTKSRKQTMVAKSSQSSEFASMSFDAQGDNSDEVITVDFHFKFILNCTRSFLEDRSNSVAFFSPHDRLAMYTLWMKRRRATAMNLMKLSPLMMQPKKKSTILRMMTHRKHP